MIYGGRVIDPSRSFDQVATVVIADGRIVEVGRGSGWPDGAEAIDATGLVVSPGLVDLHCHLREPGQEHKETLRSGLAAAAAGGYTTVCCMPNTTPPLDVPDRVRWVQVRSAEVSPLRLHVIASISAGLAGERLAPLADLARAGAVAFSDDGRPVVRPELMREALLSSARLGIPLSLHEEDLVLSASGAMNDGVTAASLGLPGLPAAAEEVMIALDIELLAAVGGRIHIAHVSTAGSVELVREAKRRGLRVSAEATPHHLTLDDQLVARPWMGRPYDTRAKVNPPLRSARDVCAVIEGLADGTIEAIATDHAPHAEFEKQRPFEDAPFGISLFETALASVLALVHRGHLTLPELVERLTVGPARLFGLDAGTLEPGRRADVTVLDPEEDWTVDVTHFQSKGTNTPLEGMRLRGRVKLCVAGGVVAFKATGFDAR